MQSMPPDKTRRAATAILLIEANPVKEHLAIACRLVNNVLNQIHLVFQQMLVWIANRGKTVDVDLTV
jgi:hypothetical protein